ncbi:hypothetical protein SAMN05216203_1850 [Marinobacter daqiaonensis]|uniref:Cyclic nucleotide-binding domain-containing protein n=1 Tax=Marinobacter daqiaonensis TaxID=650891 RepID=A0A1I6I5H9_9GAMM|nr:DUF6482 family protein [Marinobacter daqiaonensis]SFR62007.1 hypothetical protein SAMN05216203_1850 [Marinobacter daqiaonensis]
MHISHTELKNLVDPVDTLEIVSLEGRYYMARVRVGERWYVVTDGHDEVIRYSGAAAAREAFDDIPVKDTVVIAAAGTDEMVGMPEEGLRPMKVPLK